MLLTETLKIPSGVTTLDLRHSLKTTLSLQTRAALKNTLGQARTLGGTYQLPLFSDFYERTSVATAKNPHQTAVKTDKGQMASISLTASSGNYKTFKADRKPKILYLGKRPRGGDNEKK